MVQSARGNNCSTGAPRKLRHWSFTMGVQSEVAKMASSTQSNVENDLGFAEKAAGPCVFVLFGAAGDLTKRKLIPALFNLVHAKLMPNNFAVMGVSVDDLTVENFRRQVREFLPSSDGNADVLGWLQQRLLYERGDFGDPATFTTLRQRLADVDQEF